MSMGCTNAGDFLLNPSDRVDLATDCAAPFNPKADVAQNRGRRARAVTFMVAVDVVVATVVLEQRFECTADDV